MTNNQHGQAIADSNSDVEAWLSSQYGNHSPQSQDLIRRAFHFVEQHCSDQTRASCETYINHGLAVAQILTELNLDHETIAAAILQNVLEDTSVCLEELQERFGMTVVTLVTGVARMGGIHELQELSKKGSKQRIHTERLRKMLLAMAEDVRVVLIKLADRLHCMRTLSSLPVDLQQSVARETMDILAPLANRLGIWKIKWELEDLAFKYLYPDDYRSIADSLAERRIDRERFIEQFITLLKTDLNEVNIAAQISGRAKHIYGIWKKMTRKNQSFHEIHDILAVRVLVDTVPQCYAVLGRVHARWQYLPDEFDDYIATPKKNNYRSIHTAIIGPENKTVEVQIRTHEMHQFSELGLASHWRYKEGIQNDTSYDSKIAWLRQLLEWKDELVESGEAGGEIHSGAFDDRVYVFTPKGNVIDLPRDSTPLDFAYQIHSDVGHRCRGAKVDGNIVPLTHTLKTGEKVEVLTAKHGGPSRDWLNIHLGYIKTRKARSHIQYWFRQQNFTRNVSEGRAMLDRELKRLGLSDANYELTARHFDFSRIDDFLAALGRGDIKSARVTKAVETLLDKRHQDDHPAPAVLLRPASSVDTSGAVLIQGVGDMLTRMAKCCKPLPGDPVAGFITRGRGVTVHRRDCHIVHSNARTSPERMIEVAWSDATDSIFQVDLLIKACNREGLIRDITTLLANEKIRVLQTNTLSKRDSGTVSMSFTVEVPDVEMLGRVMARINQLPDVTEVRRRAD